MRFPCLCAPLIGAIVVALLSGAGSSAHAGVIDYGNFYGTTAAFLDVSEDSPSDPPPLYEMPTLSADSLVFNPVSFAAASLLATPSLDTTTGILSLDVEASQQYFIDQISFRESGDYTLAGTGTASTYVGVRTTITGQIQEVDGETITPIDFSQEMFATPGGMKIFNLTDHPGADLLWSGETSLDVMAILAGAHVDGHATKLHLSIENILEAQSETSAVTMTGNSVAHIAKKRLCIDAFTESNPVPEPAIVVLIGMMFLGAYGLFRQR